MLTMNCRHELRRLEADLDLYPSEFISAGVRAINRTMTTVRAEGVLLLSKEYPGLKKGSIRGQMKITRATRQKMSAAIDFTPKRFRLYGNWVRVQTKKGVRLGKNAPWRLETLDGEEVSREDLAHAFIQRPARGGPPHVWLRLGKRRYPITAILGPSLSSAVTERAIGKALVTVGHARFTVALEQEANYVSLKRARNQLRRGI